jgi:hypothetical protein
VKKSSSVAAPLLASTVMMLVGISSTRAMADSQTPQISTLQLQPNPKDAASTGDVQRGGFGNWFVLAAIAGGVVLAAGG